MSASPERRTLDEILQNSDSPHRDSHFMTPTRRLLSTPTSFRIPTDPRRVSFIGDHTLNLFADEEAPTLTNMSQISEPMNLHESILEEDYNLSPMRFTGDEHPSSVHITHIQRQFMAEVEKENEQVYNNKLDDGHSALEQEEQDDDEDDDDMRITEQLEVEASTSYQYRSPHRMPLDDITDNIQTSLQPLSFENVPNVYPQTTMPEFLKLLCISTELPELEIPRRRSVPFTSSTPLQEVVAKLYTMPMLNALKEKTRELDEWINQAETQSDMYDQQAEKKEPKSISDYINLSYSERAPHREKMGKVKEWEEIHAEIECMKDHAAFLEARQKYFHSVEKSLEEKTEITGGLKSKSVSKLKKLREHYAKVKEQYNQALIDESESKKVDRDRTIELITELKELKTVNENYSREIDENKKRDVVLDQEIEYLEAEKTRLLKEIEQHKFTIESCTPATKQDLKRIYDYYNLLTTRVGLNLISHANDKLKVSIYDELEVEIDESKLQQQQPNAIDITVKPELTKELGQWCKGLKPLTINKSQIPKIVEPLLIYWNRVRLLRRELALIQRRFVTEIQPISHDDPNNCGVIWTMALLDFESKTNIKLALEICVNEILCYPKIDISKVNTTIESGHITQEQLDAMVNLLIEKKGLTNISNSVADILKKASTPQ